MVNTRFYNYDENNQDIDRTIVLESLKQQREEDKERRDCKKQQTEAEKREKQEKKSETHSQQLFLEFYER